MGTKLGLPAYCAGWPRRAGRQLLKKDKQLGSDPNCLSFFSN